MLWFRFRRVRVPCVDLDVFLIGFVLGILMALVHHHTLIFPKERLKDTFEVSDMNLDYTSWLRSTLNLISRELDADESRYMSKNSSVKVIDRESEVLKNLVSLACVILEPESVDRVLAIDSTWARGCDQTMYVSHLLLNHSIIRRLEVQSSFELLCKTLREVRDKFDFVLITDDHTFVVLENLRYFVSPLDAHQAHYLGHAMSFWNEKYNWLEAGILLSKGTMDIFLEKFDDDHKCRNAGKYWKNADWYLGKHLAQLNVSVADTRDVEGRGRFHGFGLDRLLFEGGVSSFDHYWRDSLYVSDQGFNCCSEHTITLHGIKSASKMFQMDYIVQRLRSFEKGGHLGNAQPQQQAGHKGDVFLTQEERLKFDMWHNENLLDKETLDNLLRAQG